MSTSKKTFKCLKLSSTFSSSSDGLYLQGCPTLPGGQLPDLPVITDRSCSKENQGLLYFSFSGSALFFSSSGSNGNSSSWSSLGLEGDLYEDNLSFPTSERLVQSRNLKTDESFTLMHDVIILKECGLQCRYVSICFSPTFGHDSAW